MAGKHLPDNVSPIVHCVSDDDDDEIIFNDKKVEDEFATTDQGELNSWFIIISDSKVSD